MALLEIVKYPDPFLEKVSKPVGEFNERLHVFLDDMAETMDYAGGMGLAAVQVGRLMRVCLVMTDDGLVELVNPEIIFKNRTKKGAEACLSVPNESYKLRRHHHISVRAQDRHGNAFERDFHGIEAVCVQHEMDHMDGKLINNPLDI
ncbi:MAG: peptide deformylase [Firmicutes bacterium]|nr:peptide deformylase [Bacillota bacterium]